MAKVQAKSAAPAKGSKKIAVAKPKGTAKALGNGKSLLGGKKDKLSNDFST